MRWGSGLGHRIVRWPDPVISEAVSQATVTDQVLTNFCDRRLCWGDREHWQMGGCGAYAVVIWLDPSLRLGVADCGLLDENPADVAVARAHAIEHGISAGRYGLARQGQP
jgi:hypothetical protein